MNTELPALPTPISITAMGRSGSTWIMHVLGCHDNIQVGGSSPYETTAGRSAFQQLVNGGDRLQFESTVRSVYGESTMYFAEKNFPVVAARLGTSTPCGEIFLVRDFRDVVASSLAFNRKRGFDGFGRQDVGSDTDFAYHRAAQAESWILKPWRERGRDATLVKYEALITEPVTTLKQILSYLSLPNDDEDARRLFDTAVRTSGPLASHTTADSAVSSIGRWRFDLPPDVADASNSAFAEILSTFGYQD